MPNAALSSARSIPGAIAPPLPDELAVLPQTLPQSAAPVARVLIRQDPEYRRLLLWQRRDVLQHELLHGSFAFEHRPARVFEKLRWGGLFVYAGRSRSKTRALASEYPSHGFAVERGPTLVREGWRLPLISPTTHYFVARKVELIPPGQFTDRFSYSVRLVRHENPAHPIIVEKRVPSFDAVARRLQSKFPDVSDEVIARRARKFTEKIFPLFLTREAGMLLVLDEHLPAAYKSRVPRLIDMERDDRGFVRQLRMTWLRNGGRPISQIEFARQSADLLRVIHDVARVIHLDLRLDNMVITPEGVGFVDFGSAVKVDEDLRQNPLLGQIFGELMKTSQIQRMLDQMSNSGQVTSQTLLSGRQRVDKAVDLFYLALQFQTPHANPDLADLILYDPDSREADQLKRLTDEVMRPRNPQSPTYRSAKDLLHGIERLMLGLDRG